MTTKKLIIIIAGIIVAITLLVVIFAGAIVGIAFYSISKSEAATTAKAFLKDNAKLKQDVGNVTDFGSFITGSVNSHSGDGDATLSIKVIGEKRTANANVTLMYRDNRAWRVTGASYVNEKGQTINLMDAYETGPPQP